ncbi:MAG TPA: GspH/FimT family pseudopilin [Marinobacter sp.]|uniref:GspH/FimT family pseudopilin n=1 Tax=Marinobacter sp. TaxID=50741 RepID=UPI002D8016BB|nr:GspH/FimT family pseudopilin [Marinobacter sp.]HET8801857.1 GspH/FimT family pseudopilin [Marinobacter sp.]
MFEPVRESGFTLIELLVTVVVLAIILTMAVPSFQETIRNNRVATETNTLVGAVQLARSEAAKRGVEVSLTASGASFGAGYCVHQGGAGVNCTNTNRIRQFEPLESNLSSGATKLIFNDMGVLVNGAAVTVDITPPGCSSGEVNGVRRVRVGLGGQVTVSRVDCP